MYTFHSKLSNFTCYVNIHGQSKPIKFVSKSYPLRKGTYITDSNVVADAIRKSTYFNSYIYEEPAEEQTSEVQKERIYDHVYDQVKRTQEANKILVEIYGIDKDILRSKADALSKADELNISFPNL